MAKWWSTGLPFQRTTVRIQPETDFFDVGQVCLFRLQCFVYIDVSQTRPQYLLCSIDEADIHICHEGYCPPDIAQPPGYLFPCSMNRITVGDVSPGTLESSHLTLRPIYKTVVVLAFTIVTILLSHTRCQARLHCLLTRVYSYSRSHYTSKHHSYNFMIVKRHQKV